RHGTWPCGPGSDRSRSRFNGTEPSPRKAPMRSVAARASASPALVRSGATRPFSCSNCPAATSSGSIHGAASFIASLLTVRGILARIEVARHDRSVGEGIAVIHQAKYIMQYVMFDGDGHGANQRGTECRHHHVPDSPGIE